MIEEKAYAKVNLTLEILGKRNDGYHELRSLIVPIDLYDTLYFEKSNKDIYEGIEIDNNNILKTAYLFKNYYNIKECVKIKLIKRIPIQAGLAGGSSDSSAVLRGLNRLFNVNASNEELANIASKIGSDNPYCIYQRPMIMTGRGEILENVDFRLNDDILLIKPSFGISTKQAFESFKNKTGLKTDINELIIFNDLEETCFKLYPKLKELADFIKNQGYNSHMSGSGPTLFVIGNNLKELMESLKKFDVKLFLTKFI